MTNSLFEGREGPAWEILNELYTTKRAADLSGQIHDLETAGVAQSTGLLLYNLVREYRPRTTIETGFAFGYSTLYILQALTDNGVGVHEAIDPVETSRWHGIGLANVRRAGFNRIFKHLEMLSSLALPSHYINGDRFDFAFVDGSHLFDDTLIDAYYVDKLLADGGIMVLDDWHWMPAVRAVASFIEKNWAYRLISAPEAPNVRVYQKLEQTQRTWDHFAQFEVTSYDELRKAKLAAACASAST